MWLAVHHYTCYYANILVKYGHVVTLPTLTENSQDMVNLLLEIYAVKKCIKCQSIAKSVLFCKSIV